MQRIMRHIRAYLAGKSKSLCTSLKGLFKRSLLNLLQVLYIFSKYLDIRTVSKYIFPSLKQYMYGCLCIHLFYKVVVPIYTSTNKEKSSQLFTSSFMSVRLWPCDPSDPSVKRSSSQWFHFDLC